ncbi:glutamate--tRNA ligase [Bacteroidia bacterium]|nr:glutamate--tRNA ligase [Bacteroidia bacterium]
MVRTRFAPSPTGFMHIGNLRTALYAYLFAKKNKGSFVLRIEDTDQERLIDNAVETIYNTLRLAGLEHDEGPDAGGVYGPYIQSERKPIYAKYAQELIEKGDAYYCFCTKERLDTLVDSTGNRRYDKHCLHLSKEEIAEKLSSGIPYVIRQNAPTEGVSTFHDLVFGDISVENKELQDNVLIKSDGYPTYNFANVVDDHLMAISHVIRGMEYLSSTPNYNLLYEALGWEIPQYVHLPHIMRDKQHKLSKRSGDANFEDFLDKGFLPAAILNYVALLGWSPKNDVEKFTLDELINLFDISGISKSSAIFDEVKLRWLNSLYIKELTLEAFHEKASLYYASLSTPVDTVFLSKLLQPRVSALSDIPSVIQFLDDFDGYELDLFDSTNAKTTKEMARSFLPAVIVEAEKITDWDNDVLFAAFDRITQEHNLKKKQSLWIIRIALAGYVTTPGGATELCVLLGKEASLQRLTSSYNRLEQLNQ